MYDRIPDNTCDKYTRNNLRHVRSHRNRVTTMDTSTSETDFVRSPALQSPPADAYFESYRSFLEYFKQIVDPDDQLPVRVPSYTLEENEITGAIVDWMIQYLNDK